MSSSSLSGLDSNEEEDGGHEFKRLVSWQGNECLGNEDMCAHAQPLMLPDSELAGMSSSLG